jgi:hypothetical protein
MVFLKCALDLRASGLFCERYRGVSDFEGFFREAYRLARSARSGGFSFSLGHQQARSDSRCPRLVAMRSAAKSCLEKPSRKRWVGTSPNRRHRDVAAGRGCLCCGTNKSTDRATPRLNLSGYPDMLATPSRARSAKSDQQSGRLKI